MMLSLEPVDGFFSKLAKVYLFDKTKPLFGLRGLDPIFKVTGEFSLKICLDQVDAFHLKLDRYNIRTSQMWD